MTDTPQTPGWLQSGYDRIWMPYTQMQTAPLPEAAVKTEGSRIHLSDGRELIDGVGSWWAACHGYNHPHIVEAIRDQASKLPHVMLAGLANEPAFTLAARLPDALGLPPYRAFFSESGSVSVEVALKIAAQYWHNKGETGRKKFLCFRGGYHGDTFATMSLCDPVDGFHAAFQGVVPGQLIADLPEDDATEAALADLLEREAATLAAVIVEPLVQGAGGMLFHDGETLKRIRKLCDAHGLLLIFDEIFAGLGRLGGMLAGGLAGVQPDILTLSKTLTGGTLPLSATLASEQVFAAFQSDRLEDCLMHGPTFTGNALACAAANASLDLFESEGRLAQVQALETAMLPALAPCRDMPGVVDVRGKGAIGVVQLDIGGFDELVWLRRRFVEEGVFIRPFTNIVYLTPAYNIAADDLARLTDAIIKIVPEWAAKFGKK
ncbi:MAG TPA: adenosylmethionine--8-amino-7-oxononanoate transaminase [Rhodospirillaceae bacterium]|nr:adenosylmethionine--8-amino-7-oxononanoate transaminase [Rhodospirillaceae bacterium]